MRWNREFYGRHRFVWIIRLDPPHPWEPVGKPVAPPGRNDDRGRVGEERTASRRADAVLPHAPLMRDAGQILRSH